MATRTKASKRVVRSFKQDSEDYVSVISKETLRRAFSPEVEVDFGKFGLDDNIKLGRSDLEKLGWPKRIKVVIYNLDD